MPKYELFYFDVRGRGEVIRLLFAATKVEFIDHRVAQEEWPDLKKDMPYGQLPVLEVDGERISQSLAIARFVAKSVGLYGDSLMEQAKIDMFTAGIHEIVGAVISFFFEKDPAAKENKQKCLDAVIDLNLNLLEKTLDKNKSKYLVGDKMSWADIAAFDALTSPLIPSDRLDNHKKVKELIEVVSKHEGVAKYIKQRKGSPF